MRSRTLWVIIAVLAVVFLLRRQERREEVQAPSRPAPSGAPGPTPAPAPLLPALPTIAPPPRELSPAQRDAIAIEDLLKQATLLIRYPDLEKVRSDCRADPRMTAEKLGRRPSEPASVAPQIASLLCRRDNGGCSQLVGGSPLEKSPGECQNPPCAGKPVFVSATEVMGGEPEDCRQWTAWLLAEEEALSGRGDAQCRALLQTRFPAAELEDYCKLLADDIRTGGDRFCRKRAAEVLNGEKVTVEACVRVMEGYVKGVEACPKGDAGKVLKFDQPSCPLQARVRSALLAKDGSLCAGDPMCLAFFSGRDCEERRFVDLRNPTWKGICDQAVASAQIAWIRRLDSEGQGTVDLLMAKKKNLPASQISDKDKFSQRIDGAVAEVRAAQRKMEKMREAMNVGKLIPPPGGEQKAQ